MAFYILASEFEYSLHGDQSLSSFLFTTTLLGSALRPSYLDHDHILLQADTCALACILEITCAIIVIVHSGLLHSKALGVHVCMLLHGSILGPL